MKRPGSSIWRQEYVSQEFSFFVHVKTRYYLLGRGKSESIIKVNTMIRS
jgi:hypothetical protein